MAGTPNWQIAGDWFDHCSCAVACPCTFAEPPDNELCEAVLFWHIVDGRYGDMVLDDISAMRVVRWQGDLWAGRAYGGGGMYIDHRADESQLQAVLAILGGNAGGFPALWASMFPEGREVLGVERAEFRFEIAPDQAHWGVEIAGKVKAWARALVGPTSNPGEYPRMMNAPGSETGPGPQLVTWGKSTVCSVNAFGLGFEWPSKSAKHIPFDWSGP